MIPVALDQQMRRELAAEFGHPAFQDDALGILDGAGQFDDQFRVIFPEDGKGKLHGIRSGGQ